MSSAISLRNGYKSIKAQYANIGKDNVVVTQSTLRLEQVLSTAKTSYSFPIQENEGNATATEVRLNINDNFHITRIGVFLGKAATSADVALMLSTYPNNILFPTASVAPALETVYNSKMKIEVNNKVLVQNWDLQKHRVAQFIQQTATDVDSRNSDEDGWVDCVPIITLSGGRKNVVEVNLPAAVSTLEAAPIEVRLILMFQGFLAQNATSFQS